MTNEGIKKLWIFSYLTGDEYLYDGKNKKIIHSNPYAKFVKLSIEVIYIVAETTASNEEVLPNMVHYKQQKVCNLKAIGTCSIICNVYTSET